MNLIRSWKIHLIVLALVVLTEWIGQAKLQVGISSIVLFPMLYALVIGTVLSIRRFGVLKDAEREKAGKILNTALMLFMALIGLTLGPALPKIFELAPAFALQELGHFLGTIVLGLPVALLLGMRREAIGATYSIDREFNLGLMSERFGGDSPEFRGSFGVYLCGTLFGAIYFGLLSGWIGGLGWLDPLALAMATGVGSASMMAAASGTLVGMFPGQAQEITAVAGAANLMTMLLTPYVSVFISLPITLRLYDWFDRKFRRKAAEAGTGKGQGVAK